MSLHIRSNISSPCHDHAERQDRKPPPISSQVSSSQSVCLAHKGHPFLLWWAPFIAVKDLSGPLFGRNPNSGKQTNKREIILKKRKLITHSHLAAWTLCFPAQLLIPLSMGIYQHHVPSISVDPASLQAPASMPASLMWHCFGWKLHWGRHLWLRVTAQKHYPWGTGMLAEYTPVSITNPSWPQPPLLHIGFQYTTS